MKKCIKQKILMCKCGFMFNGEAREINIEFRGMSKLSSMHGDCADRKIPYGIVCI